MIDIIFVIDIIRSSIFGIDMIFVHAPDRIIFDKRWPSQDGDLRG